MKNSVFIHISNNQIINKKLIRQAFEIWKDIPGHEGCFCVSNLGNVKSLPRVVTSKMGKRMVFKGKHLSKVRSPNGYLRITLSYGCTYLIHRLVAQAFIPNPLNKRTVNHKNGKRDDNNVLNLEWNTYSENARHSYEKLGRTRRKQPCGKYNIMSKKVFKFSKDGELLREFDTISSAAKDSKIHHKAVVRSCTKGQVLSDGSYFMYSMPPSTQVPMFATYDSEINATIIE